MPELGYGPFALPKLYVMAINKTLGICFCLFIVGTNDVNFSNKVAIPVDDIRSVVRHQPALSRTYGNTANLIPNALG